MKKSRLQPGKQLERRTPMPRGTTPLRRTEFKRNGSGFQSGAKNESPFRSRGSVGDASPDGPTAQPAGRRNGPVKPRLESSTIPPAIRDAVLERDAYSCVRCGRYLVDTIRYGLQHRRPRRVGGSRLLHTMANLVTLCGWVGDAGTCTDHVEEQDRAGGRRDGWLVPHGVTPEEWPVLRWTAAGHEWQQPGEQWTPATPHPRQLEMGAAA